MERTHAHRCRTMPIQSATIRLSLEVGDFQWRSTEVTYGRTHESVFPWRVGSIARQPHIPQSRRYETYLALDALFGHHLRTCLLAFPLQIPNLRWRGQRTYVSRIGLDPEGVGHCILKVLLGHFQEIPWSGQAGTGKYRIWCTSIVVSRCFFEGLLRRLEGCKGESVCRDDLARVDSGCLYGCKLSQYLIGSR